jgi:hypothetical protein
VFHSVWFRWRALGVVITWAVAGACGFGSSASHPPPTAQTSLAVTLSPLVEQTMRQLRVPGAVVGVVVPRADAIARAILSQLT